MLRPRYDRLDRRALLKAGLLGPAGIALAACSGDALEPAVTASGTPSSATSVPPSAPLSVSPSASPSISPSASKPVRPKLAGVVATGLAVPWNLRFLPSGEALVTQRDTGEIVRVDAAGRVRRVGTVPGVVSNASAGGEGGLLGLALAPDFASSRWLYAYLTASDGNRVVRIRLSSSGSLGAARTVLDGIDSSIHHNGGGLAFGPDGHLYVATGDAEDTSNAQDTDSLNGKILRLTADGGVPADNPFGNAVWSSGHRNVEGLAFDDQGRLWASEFGDKAADELNRVVRGGDYGWPQVEGDEPGFRRPLATWATDDCSPSGIAVARGRAWLAALRGECLFSVELTGPSAGRVRRHGLGDHGRLRSVSVAPDGGLWVGTSNRDGRGDASADDDKILRVTL